MIRKDQALRVCVLWQAPISLPAAAEKKQFRTGDEVRHWTGDGTSAVSLDVHQFENHTIRRSASVNVADLRTIRVDLAAIRTAHRLAGIPLGLRDPSLVMVVEGRTRACGTRQRRQAAPAVPDILRRRLVSLTVPLERADPYGDMLTVDTGQLQHRSRLGRRGASALPAGGLSTAPVWSKYQGWSHGRMPCECLSHSFIIRVINSSITRHACA